MENLELVFNRFKENSGNDCVVALYQLGDMYEHAWGEEQIDALVIAAYINAAQLGEKRALSKLANIYENGRGLLQYDKQVAILFYQSAAKGIKEMQTALALMYQKGRGVKRDLQLAIEWYEQASLQDDVYANLALAEIYKQQDNGLFDNELTEKYLLKALAQNSTEAMCKLSFFYDDIGEHKKAFGHYKLFCVSHSKLSLLKVPEQYNEQLDINSLLLEACWYKCQ